MYLRHIHVLADELQRLATKHVHVIRRTTGAALLCNEPQPLFG